MNNDNSLSEEEINEYLTYLEETGLLDADIDVVSDTLQDSQVHYIVLKRPSPKNSKDSKDERIATIYESPTGAYQAAMVAEFMASCFELLWELLSNIDEDRGDVTSLQDRINITKFMLRNFRPGNEQQRQNQIDTIMKILNVEEEQGQQENE